MFLGWRRESCCWSSRRTRFCLCQATVHSTAAEHNKHKRIVIIGSRVSMMLIRVCLWFCPFLCLLVCPHYNSKNDPKVFKLDLVIAYRWYDCEVKRSKVKVICIEGSRCESNQNGWKYNHQTCHKDSPWRVQLLIILGQKGKGQGDRVTKCMVDIG